LPIGGNYNFWNINIDRNFKKGVLMRITDINNVEQENIGDNLYFVGMNTNGNLVYVEKQEPGKPEMYYVIDIENRNIYDKCFDDAAKRMATQEMIRQKAEVKNRYKQQPILSADEAIKKMDAMAKKWGRKD